MDTIRTMICSLSRKNFPMYDVGNEIDTGVMATSNITVYTIYPTPMLNESMKANLLLCRKLGQFDEKN